MKYFILCPFTEDGRRLKKRIVPAYEKWNDLKLLLDKLFKGNAGEWLLTFFDEDNDETMIGSQTEVEFLHGTATSNKMPLTIVLPNSKESLVGKIFEFASTGFGDRWTKNDIDEFERQYRLYGPIYRFFLINGRTEEGILAFSRRQAGKKVILEVEKEEDDSHQVMRTKKRNVDTVIKLTSLFYANDPSTSTAKRTRTDDGDLH